MAFIFYYREVDLQYDVLLRVFFCVFNGGGFSVKGIGAIWYICIVAWLYLLTPLFVYMLDKYENKHRGEEFKYYTILAITIAAIGMIYRLGGYFFHISWYDWLYANPIACFDLFFIGIIASRAKNYLPECSDGKIHKYRKYFILLFCLLVVTCTIKPWIFTKFYQFVSPTFFLFVTLGLLLLYSYEVESNFPFLAKRFGEWASKICPYTFAFYLWHTLLLMSVANKLNISNNTLHYLTMLLIGFLLTSYVAFIVTKMNEGIINTLLKKKKTIRI